MGEWGALAGLFASSFVSATILPGNSEIVLGAITRPWEANPVFVGMDADAFVASREPGTVKIAWTLRAGEPWH